MKATPSKLVQHRGLKLRIGPSGAHFFERNSGLNILIDEFVPPKNEWAVAPRQISIALTNACDLRCPYCFAPKTPATLELEQVASWLRELDANGALGVGFGGGEPTLFPQFAKLCVYAAENTNLAVTFTTHGHHLEDVLLHSLIGSVHFIRVSMDGVGATYERLRHRPFRELEKRLQGIKGLMPFGINYVVNADTVQDLNAAVSFAEQIGASEFLLLPERPMRGRTGLDSTVLAALKKWIFEYSSGLRLAISEVDAEGLPTCDPFPLETGLRAYAHIDANGVLKRTSFESEGVAIDSFGVLRALSQLQQSNHDFL